MALGGKIIKYIERELASLCRRQKWILAGIILFSYGISILITAFGDAGFLSGYTAPVLALVVLAAVSFYRTPGFILLLPALLICLTATSLSGFFSEHPSFSPASAGLLSSLLLSAMIAWQKNGEKKEQKNLEWLSIIDGLTETYNHRYFQQRLTEELARAERNNSKLGLAFIDIDNFKRYNDLNGHVIGDMALKKTASFLNRSTRLHDIVCRYGGDEFVIILPGTDDQEAARLAGRLIEGFAALNMPGSSKKEQALLTLSIGISSYPEPGHSKQELVKQADKALFEAKRSGKNSALVYSELTGIGDESLKLEETGLMPGNPAQSSDRQTAGGESLRQVLLACRPGSKKAAGRNIKGKVFTNGISAGYDPLKMGEAIGLGHLNMDKGHLAAYLRELNLN